jgi:prepilin-type N-terminal cleavage/methylation domain-containing protein
MYRARLAKGFTLVELLVVIAIIGTLGSIILSSLNSARNKGYDASIRSNLDNSRAQASLFYDSNGGSYVRTMMTATDVCNASADGSATGGVKGIYSFVVAAAQSAGIPNVTYDAAGGPGIAVCTTVGAPQLSSWAAQIPLRQGGYYCVDGTGTATTTLSNTLLTGSDAVCGP